MTPVGTPEGDDDVYYGAQMTERRPTTNLVLNSKLLALSSKEIFRKYLTKPK